MDVLRPFVAIRARSTFRASTPTPDDPQASSEGHLEAIQMVWYEEWQEDHDPSEDPYAQ